jgi:hypothetical protein
MLTLLLVGLICCCAPLPVRTSTLYVSATGRDTATCGATLADACATLFHAVSISSANATIALAGALWLNATVSVTHNLTITSAGARATLRPSTTALSFSISESVGHFVLNSIDIAEAALVDNFIRIDMFANISLSVSSCTFRALSLPEALVTFSLADSDKDDSPVVRNSTVVLSVVDVVLSDLDLANPPPPLFGFDLASARSDVAVELRNVSVSNVVLRDGDDDTFFAMYLSAFRVASAQVSQFLSQVSPGVQSVVRIDCLSQCGSLRFYNVTDTHLYLLAVDVCRDVLVSNSRFSGGGIQLPGKGEFPAVTLQITKRVGFDSQRGIHETGNFSVEDSVFKGQFSGAVRFVGEGDLLNSTVNVRFSRCSFLDNHGAVALKFNQQGVLCTFESCDFSRNRPQLLSGAGAGAVTVTTAKPNPNGNFVDFQIASAVTLSNCTFVENPSTLAFTQEQSGHHLSVSILNSFFSATDQFDLPLIDIMAASVTINNTLAIGAPALLSASQYVFGLRMDNTSMQCLRGWQALSRSRKGRMEIVCKECVDLHFNIGDQKLVFVNGTSDRNASVGCFNCPVGSRFNCSGGSVGAAPGFWAHEPNEPDETATLAFVKCPEHFCCDDALGCAAVDQCSHNRTAVLCGACAPGFTHAISHHGECVELSVCSTSRIAVGWLLLAAVCLTFTAFKARSNASSDGILGVAASFSNIAQILLSDMLSLRSPSSPALTTLKQILSTLFALSGFTSSQGALALTMCPLPELSSLGRLIAVGILVPTLLLLSWIVVSLFLWVRERRQQSDLRRLLAAADADDDDDGVDEDELLDASLPFRVASLGLALFDFSFFTLATTSLAVLNTIDVPAVGCRLWKAGDVPCSAALQAGGVTTFLVLVSLPFVFALVQRRWPRALFSKAVKTVQQSPFRAEVAQFNLVLIARRVILALTFALVQDGELRAMAIRTTLVACLALHLQVAPFASAAVNRIEAIALSGLVMVSLVPGGALSSYQGGMHTAQLSVLTITLLLLVGLSAHQKWRGRALQQKMSKN